MALVEPSVMINSIMGKLYNILTNGDDTVPKSEDNFFSWATPGIPIEPGDFEFLSQGLTGVVKKAKLDEIRGQGAENGNNPVEVTPQMLESLRAQDTAGLYMQARTSHGSSISYPIWRAPRTISSAVEHHEQRGNVIRALRVYLAHEPDHANRIARGNKKRKSKNSAAC